MFFEQEILTNTSLFFKGLIIGFLIAVPVGPVGILCIQRTLNEGKKSGLISGLGAACADAVYGFVAAFGISFVSDFLVEHQLWLRIISGVFLLGLGVKIFASKVIKKASSVGRFWHAGNFVSIFVLTLMNPMTLLAFTVVFAGLAIVHPHQASTSLLIVGVFIGSGLWWLTLSTLAGLFRERLSRSNLVWLNKISGTIITAFGLLILLSFLLKI
jgi:threonine/homoserine/homoserine lactone efflux protein